MTSDDAMPDLDLTPCQIPRAMLLTLTELAASGHEATKTKLNTREQLKRSAAFIAAERALDSGPSARQPANDPGHVSRFFAQALGKDGAP